MIKIKQIEFIKVVYDSYLSHNIFSIANIHFSNYPSIYGALLYWKKNKSSSAYTLDGDYKFFYDLSNTSYFASVKFPKNVMLTKAQKQELAYILLDERGSIGSYSFKTHPQNQKRFNRKNALNKISFPENFDVKSIPVFIGPIIDDVEVEQILKEHPNLTKKFIQQYCFWRFNLIKLHPEEFEPFLQYVDFSYICFSCDLLSEKYLIDHLHLVDVSTLQYNYPVLSRLSSSFKQYIIDELKNKKEEINPHFQNEIEKFIYDETYFQEYSSVDLVEEEVEEDEESFDFQFFTFDRGIYKWPGSEHLVKGIPSLASQIYDDLGYKKLKNKEMDQKINGYNEKQLKLICAVLEPHWLHRYRNKLNWSFICQYNKHLTDHFLNAHMKYVDFEALGNNLWCTVSEQFLSKHIKQFNHNKPVPLIIRHLTEQLYIKYKNTIVLDEELLYKYYPNIGDEQYYRIQQLINK